MNLEIHVASKEDECLLSSDASFPKWIDSLREIGLETKFILHKNNKTGLGKLYNEILDDIRKTERSVQYLMFLHSDVVFNLERLMLEILALHGKYDLIGLAGAKRLDLRKSPLSWFTASKDSPDGRFGNITQIFKGVKIDSFFNVQFPNVQDTKVSAIDGLCMVLSENMVNSPEIKFDERFGFDFYDLDFCLTVGMKCRKSLGVVVEHAFHKSCGESILKPSYLETEKIFKEKWGIGKDPDVQ